MIESDKSEYFERNAKSTMLTATIYGTRSVGVPEAEEAVAKDANMESGDDEITIQQTAAGSVSTDVVIARIVCQITT